MVLDLYLADTKEAGLYLAYSRRKADYGETGEHPGASLTSVTQVADFLTAAGFAEGHRGSYARRANPFGGPETGTGYRSRLRATPALIELLEGMFGVSAESVGAGQGVAGQPVRLKGRAARGEAKERVRFKHTPATEAMGRRVVAANRLRASCEYTFDGDPPERLNLHNSDLHRTFNNASFEQGGRFYGGWWQGLSSLDRARILIDGETTVELDFKAFQPRLCFDLESMPLAPEVDPYALSGFDMDTHRDAVKDAVVWLIYAPPGAPLGRGPSKKVLPDAQPYAAFMAKVEASLADVAAWLRKGRGMELQFIDSVIADGIIHAMTEQGVPCLPVHDSFIVPTSSEVALGRAMIEVYRAEVLRRTGTAQNPVIQGWTAPEKERESWATAGMRSN